MINIKKRIYLLPLLENTFDRKRFSLTTALTVNLKHNIFLD